MFIIGPIHWGLGVLKLQFRYPIWIILYLTCDLNAMHQRTKNAMHHDGKKQ